MKLVHQLGPQPQDFTARVLAVGNDPGTLSQSSRQQAVQVNTSWPAGLVLHPREHIVHRHDGWLRLPPRERRTGAVQCVHPSAPRLAGQAELLPAMKTIPASFKTVRADRIYLRQMKRQVRA